MAKRAVAGRHDDTLVVREVGPTYGVCGHFLNGTIDSIRWQDELRLTKESLPLRTLQQLTAPR